MPMHNKRSFNGKTKRPYKKQRLSQPRIVSRNYQTAVSRLEYKVTDEAASNVITNGGTIQELTGNLVRGDGFLNEFHGQQITPTGLQFKWYCNGGLSNLVGPADANNQTRCIIFQWLDSTVPALADVLESTASGFSVVSPIKVENRENISVLRDWCFSTWRTCYFGNTAESSSNSGNGKVFIKSKKFDPIQFKQASNATQKGAVYVLLISDSSVTPHPGFAYYSRLTFTD